MARLPSEQYLMQQIGAQVILFEDFTEREIVRFDPSDGIDAANALNAIRDSELGDEDKCYACFWAGYFAAYARHPEPERPGAVSFDEVLSLVHVFGPGGRSVVVNFDPRDANAAAMAQKSIYDSGLSSEEKSRVHFWCGFAYARAS